MNPLLRGLMSGEVNTNRPLLSYILTGIFDFVCILLAFERFDKGDIKIGIEWLIAGLAFSLIGWKWPQIKRKLLGGAPSELPEIRPTILPVAYMKAEKDSRYGLYVRNPHYDALDVEIPSARIGLSQYNLVFPGRLALFGEQSGQAFFEAWLESVEQGTLPGRDGSALHEIMRNADVEAVNFGIIYKDTDLRGYRSRCSIERTNRTRNGLEVKFLGQEMIKDESRLTN